jgi:hypothetical protein
VISGHSTHTVINVQIETKAQKAGRAAVRRYKQDVYHTTTETSAYNILTITVTRSCTIVILKPMLVMRIYDVLQY